MKNTRLLQSFNKFLKSEEVKLFMDNGMSVNTLNLNNIESEEDDSIQYFIVKRKCVDLEVKGYRDEYPYLKRTLIE